MSYVTASYSPDERHEKMTPSESMGVEEDYPIGDTYTHMKQLHMVMENFATRKKMTSSESVGSAEEYSIRHTRLTYVTAAYSHGEARELHKKDDILRIYGSRKGVWGGYN